MNEFSGLTWDHPRGYKALEESARANDGPIHWERQPLSGFEAAPIAELCSRYDVVVLDHPHLGEALATDCLQPLDALFSPQCLANWRAQSVGKSFDSYQMGGCLWALPLDAATQVMACKSDFAAETPNTWEQVRGLARETGRVALSLQGPHAALTAFSVYTSMRFELGDDILLRNEAVAVFELLADIYAHALKGSETLNPIEMLEEIQHGNHIDLCPLIFCYVNFAQGDPQKALHFTNAPKWQFGGRYGSIIGGTGLALSKKCRPTPELIDHLSWLLALDTQQGFIPENEGQPSAAAAWQNAKVNSASGNFYQNTLATMQDGTVRPRFNGYIAFQSATAEIIRDGLAARRDPKTIVEKINNLFCSYKQEISASRKLA